MNKRQAKKRRKKHGCHYQSTRQKEREKMKYKGGMISIVKEGEKVDISPKDENSVEVIPCAVVFHDDGVYRVEVKDKRIMITKEAKE